MATAHQLSLPDAVIHQRNSPVLGQLGSLRNRHADQPSERTVPTIPMRISPRVSTEAGKLQGPVTSENYIE